MNGLTKALGDWMENIEKRLRNTDERMEIFVQYQNDLETAMSNQSQINDYLMESVGREDVDPFHQPMPDLINTRFRDANVPSMMHQPVTCESFGEYLHHANQVKDMVVEGGEFDIDSLDDIIQEYGGDDIADREFDFSRTN